MLNKFRAYRLSKKLWLFITVLLCLFVLSMVMIFSPRNASAPDPNSTTSKPVDRETEWQKFIDDNKSAVYYNINPIYEGQISQACFKSSEIPEGDSCVFTNSEFYPLSSDYKLHVKEILTHLLERGYTFEKNEGVQKGLNDYTDPAFLDQEFERYKYIHISMIDPKSKDNYYLAVVSKKAMGESAFYNVPPSVMAGISDNSLIYQISQARTFVDK